jgi:hypothetical protein
MVSAPLAALQGSSLTIRGSTTIGARWSCTAMNIVAAAGLQSSASAFTSEAVRAVTVAVPVFTLRCQSGAMERAMRKAMRAEHDSTSAIVGTFVARPAIDTQHTAGVHLDGAIIVAGVEQMIVLNVAVEELPESLVRVQSTVPLTLHAFNIIPPRVLWGAVRARDAITVEVDLRFKRPMTVGTAAAKGGH